MKFLGIISILFFSLVSAQENNTLENTDVSYGDVKVYTQALQMARSFKVNGWSETIEHYNNYIEPGSPISQHFTSFEKLQHAYGLLMQANFLRYSSLGRLDRQQQTSQLCDCYWNALCILGEKQHPLVVFIYCNYVMQYGYITSFM
jgi:hypothetical protein